MNAGKTRVVKDFAGRSITVAREFAAPLADVWRAYTEAALLDQWWAPAPLRAETRTMDFVVGGHWLYAMVSPEGQRHWGRMNYLAIEYHRRIAIEDAFCDEHGAVNPRLPVSKGEIVFTPTDGGTRVEFAMIYEDEDALRKIVQMGFEHGIATCMDQLESLLSRRAS